MPARDAKLMISPSPRAFISGKTALVKTKALVKLMSINSRHCSAEVSPMLRAAKLVPALLTSTSMEPNAARVLSMAA